MDTPTTQKPELIGVPGQMSLEDVTHWSARSCADEKWLEKIFVFQLCSSFSSFATCFSEAHAERSYQRLRIDAAEKGIAKVRFIFHLG